MTDCIKNQTTIINSNITVAELIKILKDMPQNAEIIAEHEMANEVLYDAFNNTVIIY